MNSDQKKQLLQALIKDAIVQSCLNCENFDKERCKLAPSIPLPARVVVFGCKEWQMDIPF